MTINDAKQMKVYRNIEKFIPIHNAVATIGTFDGMHTGHQAIISRVNKLAHVCGGESVIITFHPHPRLVLHPEEKNIFILNTEEEKVRILSQYGIDHLIFIPFTREFASVSFSDFITSVLIDKLHVKKLVIGYDHHFGKDRVGELQHLLEYGRQYGFEVEEIAAQKVGEIAVSSTKIRMALTTGDILSANKFLGYPYCMQGRVVKGNGIGYTIGFHTANIDIADPHKLIPAEGVYAVAVKYNDTSYGGMMNIGNRPTFNGTEQTIEVNIFNFDKNIYDEFLSVSFLEKLRDEVKFPGIEQMKEQLRRDKEEAERIFLRKVSS